MNMLDITKIMNEIKTKNPDVYRQMIQLPYIVIK